MEQKTTPTAAWSWMERLESCERYTDLWGTHKDEFRDKELHAVVNRNIISRFGSQITRVEIGNEGLKEGVREATQWFLTCLSQPGTKRHELGNAWEAKDAPFLKTTSKRKLMEKLLKLLPWLIMCSCFCWDGCGRSLWVLLEEPESIQIPLQHWLINHSLLEGKMAHLPKCV